MRVNMTIMGVIKPRSNVSYARRVEFSRALWIWQVRMWLRHSQMWFQHSQMWFQHAECDFDTNECDWHTHELNFNTMRVSLTGLFVTIRIISLYSWAKLGTHTSKISTLTSGLSLFFLIKQPTAEKKELNSHQQSKTIKQIIVKFNWFPKKKIYLNNDTHSLITTTKMKKMFDINKT
jgi:hypothetical protein